MKKKVLVTGVAGFIGYHLCEFLLRAGHSVIGIDNINSYYDVNLKFARLNQLGINSENADIYNNITESSIHSNSMIFVKLDINDKEFLPKLFSQFQFDLVCNLAAQAGVRYSIKAPQAYLDSNLDGFLNILECCRNFNIKKFVYASSSSVYGNSDEVPFKEDQNVDNPISLYAATKKSNELMAYCYSHLYNFETIGLRFFTVYGPWGRPDMAMFLFTESILNNKPINVFNNGNLSRDFTYIDDIVDGVGKVLLEKSKNSQNYNIYNIGNSKPVKLLNFIEEIEKKLNKNAKKNMMAMQDGDVNKTYANVSKLQADYNYHPKTSIAEGIEKFVSWYSNYYKK
jgi:UDP-glucuronate 4-epimerase